MPVEIRNTVIVLLPVRRDQFCNQADLGKLISYIIDRRE